MKNNKEIFEVWKDVSGYEDYFRVSNTGKIFSKRTNKILKLSISKSGYQTLSTKIGGRNGKCFCFKVHRLVAVEFISNPQNKPFVNHINGVKTDNRFSNLEWCTSQENIQHSFDTGLNWGRKGEKSSESRFTNKQAKQIRNRFISGCRKNGIRSISRDYGVSPTTIRKIIDNKRYKE